MSSAPVQYLALVTKEEGSDWSVVFPDLPGCVTAGRSLDEAVEFAEEALALHVHGLREDGEAPLAPSGIEDVMADPESAGALFYLVPLKPLEGRTLRVNITLDGIPAGRQTRRHAAKQVGSRSGRSVLAAAARDCALDNRRRSDSPRP